MKKFEFGLSNYITPEQYDKFLAKYHSFIDYIYYSVPGEVFQTRVEVYSGMSRADIDSYMKSVFRVIEKYDIKTELCLNSYSILDGNSDIRSYVDFCYDYCKIVLDHIPEAVVSLSGIRDEAFSVFPDAYHIYSFNNGLRSLSAINAVDKRYDEVVVLPHVGDDELIWKTLKDLGFNVRILINNGCSPNCFTCKNSYLCKKIFFANIAKYGLDYVFAKQSIFPSELWQVLEKNEYIDSYKISSRPSEYEYLSGCFDSYINNKDITRINLSNYSYFARLAHFRECNLNLLNLRHVMKLKESFWDGAYKSGGVEFK